MYIMKQVDRIVYVGGLNTGQASADKVGNDLSRRGDYRDVEVLTFSQVVRNPELLQKIGKDAAALMTHSAGAVHLDEIGEHLQDKRIDTIAPPVKRSALALATGRTVSKLYKLLESTEGDPERKAQVMELIRDQGREIARHPWANLSQLGRVAAFDIRDYAKRNPGIIVGTMSNDSYFNDDVQKSYLYSLDRPPYDITFIEGEHDDTALEPRRVLDEHYRQAPLR